MRHEDLNMKTTWVKKFEILLSTVILSIFIFRLYLLSRRLIADRIIIARKRRINFLFITLNSIRLNSGYLKTDNANKKKKYAINFKCVSTAEWYLRRYH